ncbi:M-phase inducer phosphatase 1 [Balamuthia mandrillaris]
MAETRLFSTSPPMTEHFGSQQLQPEGLAEEEEHCSSACSVPSASSASCHRGSSLHSSSSSTASFSMEWEGSAASASPSALHVPHPGPTVLPRRLSPQPLQDRALSPLSQMTEHLSKYTLSSPCTSPAPSNNPASSSSSSTHRSGLSLSGLSSSSSSSSMVTSPSSSLSSSLSGGLPRCFIENSVLASPQPLSPRQHPMFLEDDDDYDDDEEDNDEQDEDASDLDGSDAENEGGRLRLSALSSIPEIMVKSPPNKTITNSHVGKNQKREPLAERKDHNIPPIPIAAVRHKGEATSTTDDVHKRWALNSNNRQSMEELSTTDNHLFPIAQKSKSEGDLPSSSEDEKENVCNASATTAYSVLGALSSPQLPGDLKQKRNKSARLRSKQLQNLVEGSAARRNTCLSATNSPALSQRGGRSTCAQELQARVQAKKQELMANNPLRRRSCSVSAAESGGMHGSGFEFAEPSDFAASFSSSSNASTNCLFTQSSNDVPVRTKGTDNQLARLRAERLQVQAKVSGRQSPTSSASSSFGRIGTTTLPLIPEGSALTSNLNLSPRYSLRRSNSQDLLHISPRRRKGRKKDSSLKKCFLMDPIPAAPPSSSPSLSSSSSSSSSSVSSSASSTSSTDTDQSNNAASNIFRQLSNSCSNVPLQRRPRSASPALSANTNTTSELGAEASSSITSAAVPVPSSSLRRGHSMTNIYEGIHAEYNRDFSEFLRDGNEHSDTRCGRAMSEKCASSACGFNLDDDPFASSPPESFFMSGTVSVRQKKEQMKPRVRGMGLRRTVSEMNIQSRYVQCTTGTHAAPRKRKQRNPLTLSLSSLPEEDLRTNHFNGELPVIPHSQYNSIEPATLHRLLDGDLKHLFREVYVVDCRYPYEYEGGHIKGAVNLHTPEQIESMFMGGCTKQGEFIAIVFHCEFSSVRGPQGYRYLRSLDREANINRYPHLFYPNMFLLVGGYKKFFEYNKEYCDPPEYVTMEDTRFISMKVQHIKENKRSFKKQRSLSFCFTRPSTFGWNPLTQLMQNQESTLSLSSPGLLIHTDTSSSSTSSSSSSSFTTGPNETNRSNNGEQ